MMNIDNNVFLLLHSLANKNPIFDNLVVFFAEYLPYIVVVLVVSFILIKELKNINRENYLLKIKDSFNKNIIIFTPAVISWVFATVLKYLVKRPRPFIELSDLVNPLFTHGGMDSFPSGHASFFIALGISALSLNKKFGWIMIACALVIGVTRIISGIHFPIDILCGFIFGIIISIIFNSILKNKAK